MKVAFFTAMMNVEVSPILGRGDQIANGLYITTDKSVLPALMPPQVERSIGGLESGFLHQAPAILYSYEEVDDTFQWAIYLAGRLAAVKSFFNTMWLFKDNAADSELGFLTYPVPGNLNVHSNALSVAYDMADGSKSIVKFSRRDLKEIREFYRSWVSDVVYPAAGGIVASSEFGRVSRAFYWIQAARGAKGGERIASYCTAMESLFATSTFELAHQLAERMAVSLADSEDERRRIYHQVKRAYGYRSRVVHGDVLKPSKTTDLIDVAITCDELLRQAILRVVEDSPLSRALSTSNDDLDRYFLRLLFAERTAEAKELNPARS